MGPVKHHVIFIATSTEEKIRDFNIIAQAKSLPIRFFNLRDLVGTLHNTLEDGSSAEENAQKKLMGVAQRIEECRKDPVAVEEFCHARGIVDYAPERIWFGTEDSGVTMPREIWDNIPKEFLDVLPDDVKERLKEQTSGPGVDTAPFLSATLGASNIGQIIEAGLSAFASKKESVVSLSHLLFREESVLKLQPMKPDRQGTYRILTAHGVVENNYSELPYIPEKSIGGRMSNYNYVAPRKKNPDHKSAAELGVDYIAKHSARAAVVDKLVYKINEMVGPEHHLRVATGQEKYDLFPCIAHPADFHVGIVNLDNPSGAAGLKLQLGKQGTHLKSYIPPVNEEPPPDATVTEKATFYLSAPERLLAKSDGLVFLPDSARTDGSASSLEEKLYILQSAVVAKQLIGRDRAKPFVIVNTDHSWDDAIRIHTALAQSQMTKDYAIPLTFQLPGVEVVSNGYFDIVSGGDSKAGLEAAAYLMKERSLYYRRVTENPPKILKEGLASPTSGLVAIFCSASCENAPLNRFVKEIACELAKKGQGLVCGGGDRYTMGAILDGVKQAREWLASVLNYSKNALNKFSYIAGISTEPIAAAETNSGEMPQDYSTRELAGDIYERMAKMLIPAKTVIVAPGGAGTIQEWMGFNLLKDKMPALFRDKKLVIFDPDLIANLAESVSRPISSMQNRVFDGVLDIVFNGQCHQYRLNNRFNTSGIHIASTVEEVVRESFAGKKPAFPQLVPRSSGSKLVYPPTYGGRE